MALGSINSWLQRGMQSLCGSSHFIYDGQKYQRAHHIASHPVRGLHTRQRVIISKPILANPTRHCRMNGAGAKNIKMRSMTFAPPFRVGNGGATIEATSGSLVAFVHLTAEERDVGSTVLLHREAIAIQLHIADGATVTRVLKRRRVRDSCIYNTERRQSRLCKNRGGGAIGETRNIFVHPGTLDKMNIDIHKKM